MGWIKAKKPPATRTIRPTGTEAHGGGSVAPAATLISGVFVTWYIVAGTANGCLYALMALALVLIYKTQSFVPFST